LEQYKINDLERLTGIKAHTIRIWEKRYMLIKPSRTATNRRFYNGDQLLKLMNVSTLLSQGYKISNLAILSDEEIKNNIEQLHKSSSIEAMVSDYINSLTYFMLSFDEIAFENLYNEVVAQVGLYDAMVQVFYPFLINTGILWRVKKTLPIEEHFALCIIRRKLIAATDRLSIPKANSKKFLLFLPTNEWHEIGLLFGNYILRSMGFITIYLGQNVPLEDISRTYSATKPDYMLTFFISAKPKTEIESEIVAILKATKDTTLLISGSWNLLQSAKYDVKRVAYLKDVNSLSQYF
jgi:DNA-binding transcriptional MerR regulator